MTPAMKMYMSCVLNKKKGQRRQQTWSRSLKGFKPSSLYPVDNVPAHPQRVRSVQQPLLSPFQYVPLIHQVVQDSPSLRDEIIQRALCVLNETVLSQRVFFPGRGHEVWGL